MSFEVPVATIGGKRRGWLVIAAAGAFVGLIVLAAAVGTARGEVAAATPLAGSTDAGPRTVRALPAAIECHDVDDATCLRLARAAIVVLPDDLPALRDATVWRSLLCNDDFDCPGPYLEGSVPLGSVIVRFVDDSPPVAINVVDRGYAANVRPGTRAWVVRWRPGSG